MWRVHEDGFYADREGIWHIDQSNLSDAMVLANEILFGGLGLSSKATPALKRKQDTIHEFLTAIYEQGFIIIKPSGKAKWSKP